MSLSFFERHRFLKMHHGSKMTSKVTILGVRFKKYFWPKKQAKNDTRIGSSKMGLSPVLRSPAASDDQLVFEPSLHRPEALLPTRPLALLLQSPHVASRAVPRPIPATCPPALPLRATLSIGTTLSLSHVRGSPLSLDFRTSAFTPSHAEDQPFRPASTVRAFNWTSSSKRAPTGSVHNFLYGPTPTLLVPVQYAQTLCFSFLLCSAWSISFLVCSHTICVHAMHAFSVYSIYASLNLTLQVYVSS